MNDLYLLRSLRSWHGLGEKLKLYKKKKNSSRGWNRTRELKPTSIRLPFYDRHLDKVEAASRVYRLYLKKLVLIVVHLLASLRHCGISSPW